MKAINSVGIGKLTRTHFDQLLSYIENRDREEWYYGNRKQFEKRHEDIKQWINVIIDLLNKKCPECSKLIRLYDADDKEVWYGECNYCGYFGWIER